MDFTLKGLGDLLMLTVRTPQAGAKRLLSFGLGSAERWQALALVVILSVILTQLTVMMAPADEAAMLGTMLGSPLQSGLVQAAVLVAMVFAVHLIGRAMGGLGDLNGAVLVVAWLEFTMVCLQGVQLIFGLLLPVLAPLVGVFGIGLFFWLLTQFVLVLHGFRSPAKVFVMIVISLFVLAFLLALLFGILGVTLVGGNNV